MSNTRNNPLLAAIAAACDCGTGAVRTTRASRRDLLKASGMVAAAGAASLLPQAAFAQTNLDTDPALRRLLASPRILLKCGIVLTLDRQIGDFAKADVMIEDGKIREIQPNIMVGRDTQLVD